MSWAWQPLPAASGDSAQVVVPAATSLTFTIPSPTLVKGAISRVADPTALTFTIPTPTVVKTKTVVVEPIALSFALPTPDRVIGALAVVPDPTPLLFTLPGPTVIASQIVTASPIALNFALPAPTIFATQVITPDPIALSFALPEPTRAIGALTLVPDPTPLAFTLPTVDIGAGVPATGAGGGDDLRGKRRRRGDRDHRWRDPLYATAELQRELTEDDGGEDLTPEEIVAEAFAYVGGALMPATGGLVAELPAPPEAVARELVASNAWDWSEVIAAIKEAHRRTRDREERGRILRYRAKVEALRKRLERERDDDESVEVLMVSGWL